MRLLIVEDDRAISQLLQDALIRQDHVVAGIAGALAQGLALAQSVDYDCAIVDIDLNGSEALPLVEWLESQGRPCVLITGLAPADIASARLRKMPRLLKPFDYQSLDNAIALACRGN